MGRGYASELERGLVNPSLAALLRVAEALGLPVADLLLGETARERLYEYLREWPEPRVEQLLHSLEAQHAPLSRAAEEASHYSPRAAPKKRR